MQSGGTPLPLNIQLHWETTSVHSLPGQKKRKGLQNVPNDAMHSCVRSMCLEKQKVETPIKKETKRALLYFLFLHLRGDTRTHPRQVHSITVRTVKIIVKNKNKDLVLILGRLRNPGLLFPPQPGGRVCLAKPRRMYMPLLALLRIPTYSDGG